MKKVFLVLFIMSILILPVSVVSAEESSEITPMYMLGWENTWQTFTEEKWEKSISDYSSTSITNTSSYTTIRRAASGSEAIAKVEAGASAGVKYSGLSASVNAGTEITDKTTGETTSEYTVTGTKVESYIQYYDLYNQYIYYYYIYHLVDEYGNVHDIDYKGKFRYKSFTGSTMEMEGRRSAY